jgi:TRAP-type C4-dicarboxylate transport system permease small subunit
MYIIAIAWIYVTILMAATEKSITSGILTFVFYGLLPCALLLWILGIKHRRFKKLNTQANETTSLNDDVRQPNGRHTEANE